MISRLIRSLLTITPLLLPFAANAQEDANVARMVVWQMKPGMARDFEEGYKRHLDWHRKNNDTWTWRGWTIVSGEHFGYFVDGTFFHTWKELDTPVSPAADSADNGVNVMPYAEIRSAAFYEAVPALTNLSSQQLAAPLLTFYYLDVQPSRGAEFESLMKDALSNVHNNAAHYVLLRPANGVTEYLLLLTAEKESDLGTQAAFMGHLLQAVARNAKQAPIVGRFRTETASYRSELSNAPEEKLK